MRLGHYLFTVSSTHPLLSSSLGHYDALRPSVAFEFSQDPSVGQIALAFLQASFAYSGWNFLNYVTEEVVEPRKYGTHMLQIVFHISTGFHIQQTRYIGLKVTLAATLWNIMYSSVTWFSLLLIFLHKVLLMFCKTCRNSKFYNAGTPTFESLPLLI